MPGMIQPRTMDSPSIQMNAKPIEPSLLVDIALSLLAATGRRCEGAIIGLVKCEFCEAKNPAGATVCRSCGSELPYRDPETVRPALSIPAVLSIICGILAPCTYWVSGVLGVVFGLLAILQIHRSRGGVRGFPLAFAGLLLSAAMLAAIPLFLSFVFPMIRGLNEVGRSEECQVRLRKIGMAMALYAESNEGRLPPGDRWSDAIKPMVQGTFAYRCPSLAEPCGYAYHSILTFQPLNRISGPRRVPLVFDSQGGWNRSGGLEMLDARHRDQANILFLDYSVRLLSSSEAGKYRW